MKNVLFLLFILASFSGTAQQPSSYDSLFALGKAEFTKAFDDQNFKQAVAHLEAAKEIRNDDPELWYFLGYAYSKLNSKDARSMITMTPELTAKSTEAMEKVISLSPKYEGEIIALDPYSKITSEWGSQAMAYLYRQREDSAMWAFNEGKKRGGFSEFMLACNRLLLDECSTNAILFTSGDNFTIPLWYLQNVEGYRKDVAVVDAGLINSVWYPQYLDREKIVAFDVTREQLDSLDFMPWRDSLVTIGTFSWTVKPTYYNQYVLRGDRVLLSLLRDNNFKRDIFFTLGFNPKAQLNLYRSLSRLGAVDKLTPEGSAALPPEQFNALMKKALGFSSLLDTNRIDELRMYENYRYTILSRVGNYLEDGEKEKAKSLFALLEKYGSEDKIPYYSDGAKAYATRFREYLAD